MASLQTAKLNLKRFPVTLDVLIHLIYQDKRCLLGFLAQFHVVILINMYHLSHPEWIKATVKNDSLLLCSLMNPPRGSLALICAHFYFCRDDRPVLLLFPFTQLFDMMIGVFTGSLFDTSSNKLMLAIRTWSDECKSHYSCRLINALPFLREYQGFCGELIPHV